MTPFDAWILGMVEGITEYLPVSSTGHLVLTSWLLGLDRTPEQRQAVHDFEIIIQGGAILAVLGLYRARVGQMLRGTAHRLGVGGLGPVDRMRAGWTIARNVAIAFVPAAAVGFAAKDAIKEHLFNAAAVVGALASRGLDRRMGGAALAMLAGLAVIFTGGVSWLAKDTGLQTALMLGLYPFVLVDVLKIVAASTLLPAAWRMLGHRPE